ncbi:MAG: MarR family transcriptional regulator [Hyphomicrobiales bacterium]|nr:MarR family transcriptional regulator [Hyphomicrobiales bacterium]
MIIKRKHTGSFAMIPNATADDERLAADTLGTLVYLLAKPEDWKVIVADIRRRFGIGRNRVYQIIRELEAAGYVQRAQNRAERSRWGVAEYIIYDCPVAIAGEADIARKGHLTEGGPLPDSPLPQNRHTVKAQQNTVSLFTVYGPTAYGERAHILNTKSTKSLRGENPSAEAGADAPQEGLEEGKSLIVEMTTIGGQQPTGEIKGVEISTPSPPSINQEVWQEGFDLLKTTSLKPNRSIIGKWLKRTSTKREGAVKLLAIIRAASKAGTLDPIAYISKALDSEFAPLPQPKKFDEATWQRNVQAAIKTKDWPQGWGPLPGKKGCLVPPELLTDELFAALAGWRVAA